MELIINWSVAKRLGTTIIDNPWIQTSSADRIHMVIGIDDPCQTNKLFTPINFGAKLKFST